MAHGILMAKNGAVLVNSLFIGMVSDVLVVVINSDWYHVLTIVEKQD